MAEGVAEALDVEEEEEVVVASVEEVEVEEEEEASEGAPEVVAEDLEVVILNCSFIHHNQFFRCFNCLFFTFSDFMQTNFYNYTFPEDLPCFYDLG